MPSAVITGIGLVTALGSDRVTTWENLVAGQRGIGPLTLFDTSGFRTHTAAQVREPLSPLPHPLRFATAHGSRACRFVLQAAFEALADAGLKPAPGAPWGVVLGGGATGLLEAETFLARRLQRGPRTRGLLEFLDVPQDAPADRVAWAWQLTGERLTINTACSSSAIAVGLGADLIVQGRAEVVLAGGADALCRLTFAGFNALRAVDPEGARPFDRRRRGLSLGEGAAVLVLEEEAAARRRGRRPYARILGYGVTNDAYHMTQPEPSGSAWSRTVEACLAAARLAPDQVDYINAHGTATEQNDPAECAAYRMALGERLEKIPVSSVKGALGHCLCAAGGIETAITALSLAYGVVPPTAGFQEPDPACPIDPVPGKGREVKLEVALTSSFAFGGNSAVLALEKAQ